MARETLFHILLRQPWWVTLLAACAIFAIANAVFPPVAPFMAMPFALLCAYIAYRQWRGGAPANADEHLAALRAMSWEAFSAVVEDAYRSRGYAVAAAERAGYDFVLTKGGRVTLLQCRQWKVNQVGVGPLRELARAIEREGASDGVCLATGSFSAPARELVATEPVALLAGDELARMIGPALKRSKARAA